MNVSWNLLVEACRVAHLSKYSAYVAPFSSMNPWTPLSVRYNEKDIGCRSDSERW